MGKLLDYLKSHRSEEVKRVAEEMLKERKMAI